MRAGVKSAATLVVLGAVLFLGVIWGWSAVMSPFPEKIDLPVCEATPVHKGDKIFPAQVVVSVFNAGDRLGLAGTTMRKFEDGGFQEGDMGNAPKSAKVPIVQIWAAEPRNPAVRLVESRLGPAHKVIKKDGPGAGITVIVGDGFRKLLQGPRFVVAHKNTTICSPPVG